MSSQHGPSIYCNQFDVINQKFKYSGSWFKFPPHAYQHEYEMDTFLNDFQPIQCNLYCESFKLKLKK